jgi:hypothetical protein
VTSNVQRRTSASDVLDQTAGNNFAGTGKMIHGDCPATMTLAACEAAYPTQMRDYKDINKSVPHPAGIALYRTDSFISDVPAKRMNAAAVKGDCKGKGYTVRQLADCIRKKMP